MVTARCQLFKIFDIHRSWRRLETEREREGRRNITRWVPRTVRLYSLVLVVVVGKGRGLVLVVDVDVCVCGHDRIVAIQTIIVEFQ